VTICTEDRECLFGEIAGGTMELNDAARMIARWWAELNRKFPTVKTDEQIVMPNHFHDIVAIIGYPDPIGAALRGRSRKTMATQFYYEHIVRDDDEMNRIRQYIANNPAHWPDDENHPARLVGD
jgi:REP element-mobilizing transposase RayT